MDTAVTTAHPGTRVGAGAKARAYLHLTKPRIIELLLITTIPVMFLAARGIPSLWLVLATLVGGALSAGSAAALRADAVNPAAR